MRITLQKGPGRLRITKIHLESVEGLELVKVCRSGGKTKSEVNAKAENEKRAAKMGSMSERQEHFSGISRSNSTREQEQRKYQYGRSSGLS